MYITTHFFALFHMDIRKIELFRAVMIHNGINRAAAALGVAQPNISRAITALEKDVGFLLFDRIKRRVTPTDEGIALFREIQHSFAGLDRIRQAAHDIREFGTGHLKVASLMALAFDFAPRAMKRFALKFPEAAISFQARPSSQVWEYTAGNLCEIGFAGPKTGFTGVKSKTFLTLNAVAVLPKGHRLVRKSRLSPQHFSGERFISLALEDPTRHLIDLAFSRNDVDRKMIAESQSASVLCSMAANALGITIAHPLMALEKRYNNLVFRPLDFEIPIDIELLAASERRLSRLAMEFIDAMEAEKKLTIEALSALGLTD